MTAFDDVTEVSVSIMRDPETGEIRDVEVIQGRFSENMEVLPYQQIFVGNLNGGDSLDMTHRHTVDPDAEWWPDTRLGPGS